MKQLPRWLISILFGWATVGVLYAIMLYLAGGAYAIANGWCSPLFLNSLLYCQFLPDILIIAFIGGLVIGVIRVEGRLRAGHRSAITAIVSCLVISFISIRPDTVQYIAAWLIVSLVTLLFVIIPMFLGAAFGDNLTRRKLPYIWLWIALLTFGGLAIIIVQGMAVKNTINIYESSMPTIKAAINSDLIVLDDKANWMPFFKSYLNPKLCGARCGDILAGCGIKVGLTSSGGVLFAHVTILDALDDRDKSEVSQVLRNYGVRPAMIDQLKWIGNRWYIEHGKYSISISDY